ncbi:MAG: acetyl/propionyl-CoA carboxylase alpha subunit [Candidatus Azotimanducaceae bacterium]|jgi:acetyl/propionyl-CoA carboxylase alpha subunit
MEAMTVFTEMGISDFGILLSEKDSITYPNALSPELRMDIDPARVHRVQDYTGATKEERAERINQIIKIANANGYDSIFAGYGFMAEDEEMVRSMESAGLNFIGPCSRTIRSAGSKDLAKRTALDVNVSVTPGVDNATTLTLLEKCPTKETLIKLISLHDLVLDKEEVTATDSLEAAAELLLTASYYAGIDLISADDIAKTLTQQVKTLFENDPDTRIRLKAIGGGGGKGQRILSCPTQFEGDNKTQLAAAIAQTVPAFREILSEVKTTGVGDNKNVLAEINIETVRHEEIQVVGNGDWCLTLGGRDCSVQMNEQKLLEISVTVEELQESIDAALSAERTEEAEALKADLSTLIKMEDEASRFGAAVGLDSVSTFECILDRDRHFFMEMNTRVQVEHRVTELCYSLRFTNPKQESESFLVDSIVELMVLLAQHGPQLPRPIRERRENSAVEVRLNASDDALKPHAGGVITQWSDVLSTEIRDDQGICLHNPDTDIFIKYHLAGAYDSNIALLLTTGQDRDESYARMADVLRKTRLTGENLGTNLSFHYGMINWFIGNSVNARPATNFVSPYLAAVGKLKILANSLDIVYAYNQLEANLVAASDNPEVKQSVQQIMQQKSSLLARALNQLFAQPHYLAGWLAINKQYFDISKNGIKWLANPIWVLSELYHYLNMDARDDTPALYAIWDHDQEMLQDALDFYEQLEALLGCDDWLEINERLSSNEAQKLLGEHLDEARAAHTGFQLGMDILLILPYIGLESGFYGLQVKPDLKVEIPSDLFDKKVQADSLRALSPPPNAAVDEITAPTGGMFYAREAPELEAFVIEGQHFDKGDPLFIVEVMKMFNKVYATFSGTIDKILIDTDASIVKKGEVAFKVTPDEIIETISDEEIRRTIVTHTNQFIEFLA